MPSYESEHSTLDTSSGAMAQIAAVGKDAGLDSRFIDCMRTYALLDARGSWAVEYPLLAGRAQASVCHQESHALRSPCSCGVGADSLQVRGTDPARAADALR